MTNWIEFIVGTIIGGIARFEIDSFLKRHHNHKVEEAQAALIAEQHTQTLIMIKQLELLDSIQKSVAKG